jgi:hypothetical protein
MGKEIKGCCSYYSFENAWVRGEYYGIDWNYNT